MFEPLITDKAFKESHDSGHPDCLCSRCGHPIKEQEAALRMWTTNEKNEVDENSLEYRYCEECQGAMGIQIYRYDPDPDLDYKPFDTRKIYDWEDLFP